MKENGRERASPLLSTTSSAPSGTANISISGSSIIIIPRSWIPGFRSIRFLRAAERAAAAAAEDGGAVEAGAGVVMCERVSE